MEEEKSIIWVLGGGKAKLVNKIVWLERGIGLKYLDLV